jgi:hypothetical protein
MDQQTEVDFCGLVAARVSEQYGFDDGADLCFNLLESGQIDQDASVEQASRQVAMHLDQA